MHIISYVFSHGCLQVTEMSRSATGCVLALTLLVFVACEVSMATPWRPPRETSDGRDDAGGLNVLKKIIQLTKQVDIHKEIYYDVGQTDSCRHIFPAGHISYLSSLLHF